MNAPTDRWEPYRVILDYEALQDGFLDRIDDLNTTLEQIDMNSRFAKGNTQKLLTKSDGKRSTRRKDCRFKSARRTFGWESLGKMLEGTGLALVLVVDDERFSATKEQLAQRKRPRQPANAGMKRPVWLFTSKKAREMGKKRLSNEKQKTLVYHASMQPIYAHFPRINEPVSAIVRHQRKAGKASARARRRKAAQAGALIKIAVLPDSQHGQPTPNARAACCPQV